MNVSLRPLEDRDLDTIYQQVTDPLELVQVSLIEKTPISGSFAEPSDGLEPSTPSLPWRFQDVTRVHARSLATRFLLQIALLLGLEMRREASRVSFLMCPFCVRGLLTAPTTDCIPASD